MVVISGNLIGLYDILYQRHSKLKKKIIDFLCMTFELMQPIFFIMGVPMN